MTDPTVKLPSRIAILGAARSGLAAAHFLRQRGVDVFISETCAPEKLKSALAETGLQTLPHEAGG
ncbi:MAG: hypothetical protein PHC61_19210, partial [Chitinivibrionales bacterium]|nr:hypothetical protein [Chitinivibrionales bacterium]